MLGLPLNSFNVIQSGFNPVTVATGGLVYDEKPLQITASSAEQSARAEWHRMTPLLEAAYSAFNNGDWQEARQLFEQIHHGTSRDDFQTSAADKLVDIAIQQKDLGGAEYWSRLDLQYWHAEQGDYACVWNRDNQSCFAKCNRLANVLIQRGEYHQAQLVLEVGLGKAIQNEGWNNQWTKEIAHKIIECCQRSGDSVRVVQLQHQLRSMTIKEVSLITLVAAAAVLGIIALMSV